MLGQGEQNKLSAGLASGRGAGAVGWRVVRAVVGSAGIRQAGLRLAGLLLAVSLVTPLAGAATTPASTEAPSVFMEDLTWPELQKALAQGSSTVLVPIGGTEQNGPQMTLGKHNHRVHTLAGLIAQKLGQTVVAPVLAFVPEGAIKPPQAHMRFMGTLTIPEATFEALLEATARSLKQHGFKDVFFLGDHGGYQKNLDRVAAKLNREWAADPSCRVYNLNAYYRAASSEFGQWLQQHGYSLAEVGSHAGLADTSLSMATDPYDVRPDALAQAHQASQGVYGDARRASAALGQSGLDLIVQRSVSALQTSLSQRKTP